MTFGIGYLSCELSGADREKHESRIRHEADRLGMSISMIVYAESHISDRERRLLAVAELDNCDAILVPTVEHLPDFDLSELSQFVDVYCLDTGQLFTIHDEEDDEDEGTPKVVDWRRNLQPDTGSAS